VGEPLSSTQVRGTAVDCRGLEVRRRGLKVLGGVDLEVSDGELVGVVGPNGAGKSTLLRVLAGLDPPAAGTLEVCGHRLERGRPRPPALRLEVGSLLQHHDFSPDLPFRVGEVVGFGRAGRRSLLARPSPADRDAVHDALARLGIGPLEGRLYRELSGGERRKVQLARLLAQGARLLLLDEPASGLDLEWQERLTGLVEVIHRGAGAAVVMVTHEVGHLPASCSRVLLLRGGAVVASGQPREVLRADLLERTYGCPMVVSSEGGRYHAHARPVGGVG